MIRFHLKLSLAEPIIISANNTTAGLYETLDYIPGTTLLGAFAAKNYAKFKTQGQHLAIFHSGQVRFGNLTPYGAPPVPLAFHKPKNTTNDTLDNLLHPMKDPHLQRKQIRNGFIHKNKIILPSKQLHLRTAIDPSTATAAKSQLYSYQALSPEHLWEGEIQCEDPSLADLLFDTLSRQNVLLLGRSRSAHYGRAHVQHVQQIKPQKASEHTSPSLTLEGTPYLVLWLTSDLAAFNHTTGQPTLTPNLKDLHPALPDIPLVSRHSFIRTRAYAPYNAHRKSYDPSRQVIAQGSVLVYPLPEQLDTNLLFQGLGAYTEQGLGRIASAELVDHYLSSPHLTLRKNTDTEPQSAPSAQPTSAPLLSWLQSQYQAHTCKELIEKATTTLQNSLFKLYQQAAKQVLSPPYGPTPSQWNRIREIAEQYRDEPNLDTLLAHLTQEGGPWAEGNQNPNTQDRTGAAQDGWNLMVSAHQTFKASAIQAIEKTFATLEKDQACHHAGLFLRTLAHKMASSTQTRKLAQTGRS